MSAAECPKCQLPRDEDAWACDGCGYQFDQNIDAVRTRLRTAASSSRTTLWVTLAADAAIIAGIAYLAVIGFYYVSVSLLLVVVGSIGHAAHRLTVTREHLQTFERRYPQLPKAIALDQ